MQFLKIAAAGVVVAIVAGALVIEHQANAELREEVALVRSDLRELAKQRDTQRIGNSLPATAVDLASAVQQENDRAESARLRDEINALKARVQEIGQANQNLKATIAAGPGKSATDSLPVRLVPAADWKNAGRATPSAAVETVLWGAAGGDIESVGSAIEFTASAREKAQAMFDRLPEESRAKYGSPENLMALLLAKDVDKVSGMQVLGTRELSPDNVGMRLRFGNELGQTKEQSLLLHRANDGWKILLTDDPIDKWSKQLLAGK